MGVLLQVNNLQTQFVTGDGVVKAVDGVTWHVSEGECLGIVGESGCGKSVSLLSVMRLIPMPPGQIAGGEIIFEGRNLLELHEDEMRRVRGKQMAMIFQDPMTSLNPVLTINRQISEALMLHMGMNSEQARKRAIELMKMVGIPSAEQRIDNYPHQFSGGMRQRVMIAMGLSCQPKLLIADEPTTALDVTIAAQIIELVKNLRKQFGMAIIWITHDLGIVAGLTDRMIVMYAGHLVETATTKDLYGRPSHPYTQGLLKSVPRLDEARKERLVPIDGLPPDLIALPPGCPFEPRCTFSKDICRHERPKLRTIGPDHQIACWVDVYVEQPRAEIGQPRAEIGQQEGVA
ncbi:MAG: ABC transporter ATP-binding protein [Bacteroidetes bacterium]|nr:ABC transporter ATP-binding protein [Bacteroidota bacterium]MCL5025986.1 ABC transporter ATP-binding protein [Chloroflexota bacterium]